MIRRKNTRLDTVIRDLIKEKKLYDKTPKTHSFRFEYQNNTLTVVYVKENKLYEKRYKYNMLTSKK